MGDGDGEVSDSLNSFMGVASRENCGGGVREPDPPERDGTLGLILRICMTSAGSRDARGVE